MRIRKHLLALAAVVVSSLVGPSRATAQSVSSAVVAKSGRLLFFMTSDAANNLVGVKAVNAAPTVTVGGQPVTLGPAYFDNTTNVTPWVCYWLPRTVNPGTSVAWTAPAGWLTTTAGNVGATTGGTAAVYTGVNEPDFTSSTKKLKLGTNIVGPMLNYYTSYTIPSNLYRHVSPMWTQQNSSTPNPQTFDAQPTTMPVGTAQQLFAQNSDNTIDNRGYPFPMGDYTVVWDDTSPNAPTDVILWSIDTGDISCPKTASSPGTVVNGVLVGRSSTYTFSYKNNPTPTFNPVMYISLQNPATKVNTACNIGVFPPGTPVDRSIKAVDQRMVSLLSQASPKGPASIRYMENTRTSGSNVVDPEDLQSIYKASWGPTWPMPDSPDYYCPSIGVTAVRPYVIADPTGKVGYSSPYVYVNEAYGLLPADTRSALAPAGSITKYWLPAPRQGWLNWGAGQQNNWYTGEVVTNGTHHFKTGQGVTVSFNQPFTVTNNDPTGASTVTVPAGSMTVVIYVTGPNSFAFSAWGPTTSGSLAMPGGINNVAATVNFTAGQAAASVIVPDSAALPHELAATMTGAVPKANHWVNIPSGATDETIRVIARRIRDNLPPGRKVYVEYSNETWNTGYPECAFVAQMSQLVGLPGWSPQFHARRAIRCHQLFFEEFNNADVNGVRNRGGEVVRVFGSFTFGAPNFTVPMLQEAVAQGAKVDAVAIAPYYDCFPFMTGPAAAMVDQNPSSIAYKTPNPWTLKMYVDLLRYTFRYDVNYAWHFAAHRAAIAQYAPQAALITYEGGPEVLINNAISNGQDPLLGTKLSNDLVYSSSFQDVDNGIYFGMMAGGITLHTSFHFMGTPFNYGWGLSMWPYINYMGQPAWNPTTSTTTFSVINGGDGKSHADTNGSVRWWNAVQWMKAAN